MDPNQLVASLITTFNLLRTENTIVYFPITFCGTTQFLPPMPFEKSRNEQSTIPSDTVAFELYSKALIESLGHNLNPILLQSVMEKYGATLEMKRSSNWKIDPKISPYLFETMLYFFGTAGGPQILNDGWDASGWIERARMNQPTIEVSNVDLVFRFGQEEYNPKPFLELHELHEIQFIGPKEVTSVKKEIPELGPNEILSKCFPVRTTSSNVMKPFSHTCAFNIQ